MSLFTELLAHLGIANDSSIVRVTVHAEEHLSHLVAEVTHRAHDAAGNLLSHQTVTSTHEIHESGVSGEVRDPVHRAAVEIPAGVEPTTD